MRQRCLYSGYRVCRHGDGANTLRRELSRQEPPGLKRTAVMAQWRCQCQHRTSDRPGTAWDILVVERTGELARPVWVVVPCSGGGHGTWCIFERRRPEFSKVEPCSRQARSVGIEKKLLPENYRIFLTWPSCVKRDVLDVGTRSDLAAVD